MWRHPALLAALILGTPVMAEEYRLGSGDTLFLRVMEWNPVDAEVVEWPTIAGEYVVGIDGAIAVPFIGAVPVAGRSTAEVGQDIAAALTQRFALPEPPDATVQIAGYAPVYVSGLVRTPGEYVYRPGLTVQQVVSMAGGLADELQRTSGAARELITVDGALTLLEDQEMRLKVRAARLSAELALPDAAYAPDADMAGLAIGTVPGLAPGLVADQIIAAETAVMTARFERVRTGLVGLAAQRDLLAREIEVLEQKEAALRRQGELTAQELENAKSLTAKGLLASNRLIESERAMSTIENQLLDVSTAALRARQGIAAAERDRVALLEDQDAEAALDAQQVAAELADTAARIATQRQLSRVALALSDGALTDENGWPEAEAVILRAVDGTITELGEGMAAALQPGDVVEIRLRQTGENG